ncbi:carbohydrate-binding module family 42 protein [Parathielavia appendiculata]|uniref:Carbohydrate-binding module family 42 protein n=1 Tax=Parathielavia appendiculata TaxID=2587402 RepID=A0AAN6TQ72_9PEZI|nr:carbohydrate-binding module family 42 protein [Parathielavia appendiculata]
MVDISVITSACQVRLQASVSSPPVAVGRMVGNSGHCLVSRELHQHAHPVVAFTAIVPKYDRIISRQAQTIQALQNASKTTVRRRRFSSVGSGQVWGPELHFIDGKWYIYVALGVANQWRIRTFVLEAQAGVIKNNWDTFSLNASTFYHDRAAVNPWTIRGTAFAISRPTLAWERIGYKVNEGPFSASATDHNYCIGLLTVSAGADLMNPASWSKSLNPVFVSNANTNRWGPGHNPFTVSEDDLLNDPNRRTTVQKLYWKADRTPDFGVPVPEGNTPLRLRSTAEKGGHVQYYAGSGNPSGTPALPDTQFRIVSPCLVGGSTIMLESTSYPSMFLRRANNAEVQFERSSALTSAAAKASASFERRLAMLRVMEFADAAAVLWHTLAIS